MPDLNEMAVTDWRAAAKFLSHQNDPDTLSLSKMTDQFIDGRWFKVAIDHRWGPQELFGYSNATQPMGLVPLMHKNGLTFICSMDDDAADVMGDLGPSFKIQKFILAHDGPFWWRHSRFA